MSDPIAAAPLGPFNSRQRFAACLAGQPVDRPALWMMRQAGRFLPEYRAVRQQHTFLEMVHTPELAVEVTLQPLQRFGMDAAILFSDILTIPEALGIDVEFPEGGPQLSPVIKTAADVEKLPSSDCIERLQYVGKALELLRAELPNNYLLGFSGAPFTLASYMVEGKGTRTFEGIKTLMYQHPAVFAALMDKLTDAVIVYLKMQLDAGADAVQLFDSWAGELRTAEYVQHVLPSTQKITAAIRAHGGKMLLFARHTGHLLEPSLIAGADGLGLDSRIDLATASAKAKARGMAVQGNLDPIELFAPAAHIQARVLEMADATRGCGWIANLGHGVIPSTPISGVEALVSAVHGLAGRDAGQASAR